MRTRTAAGKGFARSVADAVFDAPTIVAGLDNVAVVVEAVEEGGGHPGVGEDLRPVSVGGVGGDDDRVSFVELVDKSEEELAAGLRKGEVAGFIGDDEVGESVQ